MIIFAALTATYPIEAFALLLHGLAKGPWPKDDLVVGRLFCFMASVVQVHFLSNRLCSWCPFRGAWLIGIVAETVAAIVIVPLNPSDPILDFIQFGLSIARTILLISLLCLSTQKPSSSTLGTTDGERQQLILENGSAEGSDLDYGTASIQRHQELKDRLEESGSWVEYVKGYSILIPYLWPARNMDFMLRILGIVLCRFALNILNVLLPREIAILIDDFGAHGTASPWSALAVIITLQVLSSESGIPLLQQWLITPVRSHFKERISCAVYSHIMHLSADFHDSKCTSDLLTACNGGDSMFEIIEQLLVFAAPTIIDLVVAITYLWAIFGPYQGLITIASALAFLLLASRFIDSSRAMTRLRTSTFLKEHFLRLTGLAGWRTVAAFNRTGFECDRHNNAVTTRYTTENTVDMEWQISAAFQSTPLTLGLIASLCLAVSLIWSGQASAGQFPMLILYWNTLAGPLRFITRLGKRLNDHFVEAERTLSILRTKPTVQNKESAVPFVFKKGEVRFDEVCFFYDGRQQILEDVSLSVPAGQTLAVVGSSGAGKSTLLKLINRFYDANKGAILIDGQDVRDVDIFSLRDRIGLVPQDPILFDDTIMNNVRYAKLTASDEDVFEACRAACIHDQIMGFPYGYGTSVGERGTNLSGGQLQRLAIARAILKRPDIVLLDEATSSVDTETEHSIHQSLKALCKDRTTFVVAHRLSTIMNAHIIAVFHQGQIVELGSHDDLIARDGRYASLWAKQVFLKPTNVPKNED
jgi:ABC-type multidrug transport system fused ATPase/permease subunit